MEASEAVTETSENCAAGEEDFAADDSNGKNWGDEPLAQTPGDGEQTNNGEPTDNGEGGNAEEGMEAAEDKEGETAEANASESGDPDVSQTEEKKGASEGKSEASYFCKMCQETSNETEEEHLKGRKHLKILERLEKYGSLEAIAAEFQSSTCYLCNVSAVSKSQMQSHLQGAKHKARCTSLSLPATAMDFPGTVRPQTPTKPEGKASTTVDIHAPLEQKPVCDVCNITLSSLHQLLQHLNGKRHKELVVALKLVVSRVPPYMRPAVLRTLPKKLDGKQPLPGPTPSQGPAPRFTIAPQGPPALQGVKRPATGGPEGGSAKKPKPGGPNSADGGPAEKFSCDVCHVKLNSEFQRNEHMKGKGHKDRVAAESKWALETAGKPAGPQGAGPGKKPQNAPGEKQVILEPTPKT